MSDDMKNQEPELVEVLEKKEDEITRTAEDIVALVLVISSDGSGGTNAKVEINKRIAAALASPHGPQLRAFMDKTIKGTLDLVSGKTN